MDESIIELPEMEYPVRVKTLKDHTNICTCKIKGEKKYCLVVDEMVDTVLFFHFEKKMDLLKAVLINADTSEEYYDKLFTIFPSLKAWLPSIPYGEIGDNIHIRLMDNREFMITNINWIHNNDFTYSLKINLANNYEEIINIEDIRFIHVLYSQETLATFDEFYETEEDGKITKEGTKAMAMVLLMANMHIENYKKRQLQKQIEQQNNSNTHHDR